MHHAIVNGKLLFAGKTSEDLCMREECLDFNSVEVRVRRRRGQRSLKVHVRPSGEVLVTAGYSLPVATIRRFLADAWSWVEQAKTKVALEVAKRPAVMFREGDSFLFLGEPLQLLFVEGARKTQTISRSPGLLEAQVPRQDWPTFQPQSAHPEWRKPMRRFYEAEARILLQERFIHWAGKMRCRPASLSFRCQRTRWGSCAPNASISLNWRLVAAPLEVIDYVVIHELAHLTHANHSPRFWRLVEQFCANFKVHVKWLRQNYREMDFLLPTPRSD